jgi:hypothetical protein
MVRVSNNLRNAAKTLLLCAAVAGCGSSDDSSGGGGPIRANLIQFSPSMYSAFGGSQTYSLTPFVPAADPAKMDSDPVVATSIKWAVDTKIAKQEPFDAVPGAIKLTTTGTGSSTVSLTATTMSGAKIRAESKLNVSKASDEEWAKGDARYSGGQNIDFASMFRGMMGMMPPAGGGVCGLPFNIMQNLPKEASCTNCHNTSASALAVEHTPMQTAGYSDDQLIAIFTQGMKPAGYQFNSIFLKMLPQLGGDPSCVYSMFHTWQIDEETKRGIVLKLRSITPMKQEAVDLAKVIQMARANMAASGGAAGAPSM